MLVLRYAQLDFTVSVCVCVYVECPASFSIVPHLTFEAWAMELIDLARLDGPQASGFPGSDNPSSGVLELQIRAATHAWLSCGH